VKSVNRRELLAGAAALLLADSLGEAEVISGKLPFRPSSATPQQPVDAQGWKYFTAQEARTLEALADRIIPPDPVTPGGKDAGCAVFIDRQLAGGYGHREGLYVQGPFHEGSKQQGPQSAQDPAQQYRLALAQIDRLARNRDDNADKAPFASLSAAQQDEILHGLESGALSFEGLDGKKFFEELCTDVQQ
jgi:gluconate 2-dehydrogenase gamma chain